MAWKPSSTYNNICKFIVRERDESEVVMEMMVAYPLAGMIAWNPSNTFIYVREVIEWKNVWKRVYVCKEGR